MKVITQGYGSAPHPIELVATQGYAPALLPPPGSGTAGVILQLNVTNVQDAPGNTIIDVK